MAYTQNQMQWWTALPQVPTGPDVPPIVVMSVVIAKKSGSPISGYRFTSSSYIEQLSAKNERLREQLFQSPGLANAGRSSESQREWLPDLAPEPSY